MLGSLAVALYLVSRCVEHIMGQVLARLAAQNGGGRDECGGRLPAPSGRGLHRVALHDDQEMVIHETAVNGELPEHHAEAVLLEHHAKAVLLEQNVEAVAQSLTGKRPPPPASGQPELKRRLPAELGTLIRCQYSFLDDPETVDYLRTSRVVFVLRGLPGSGKTHLAGRIARTYPGAVICSADHFFMKDGRFVTHATGGSFEIWRGWLILLICVL